MNRLDSNSRKAWSCVRVVSRLGIFTLIAVAADLARAEDKSQIERFRREYPVALTKLKQAYSRLEVEGTTKRIGQKQPQLNRVAGQKNRFTVSFRDRLQKASWTTYIDDEINSEKILADASFVFNDAQSFKVMKRPASGTDYGLNQVAARSAPWVLNPTDNVYASFTASIGKYVQTAFRTDCLIIENLLNASFYQINECREFMNNEDKIFLLKFVKVGVGAGSVSGSVEFLPERDWVARRYEIKTNSGGQGLSKDVIITRLRTIETTYRYSSVDMVPVPARVVYTDGKVTTTCDFTKFDLTSNTPDEYFTLAHYGLPDITKPPVELGRSNSIYWLIGLALLSLVASIAVMKRRN